MARDLASERCRGATRGLFAGKTRLGSRVLAEDRIALSRGTAYFSAWLARRGARPVAVDPLCVPAEGGHAVERLQRGQPEAVVVHWPGGGIEYHPGHGEWATLAAHGFAVCAVHELHAQGEGWFVLNACEASWIRSEERGQDTDFEGGQEWTQLGFRIQVLARGQRGMYHGERGQEDFLVVSGECVLVIEGEERRLRAWDFVHCPPWTRHVFVGAGDEPCVIVMVGSRVGGFEVRKVKPDEHAAQVLDAHGA